MPRHSDNKTRFEDAALSLSGCLAQGILVFVLLANILAYLVSAKYRSMFPFWKFLLCTLAWTALTLGLWWINRHAARTRSPFRTRR